MSPVALHSARKLIYIFFGLCLSISALAQQPSLPIIHLQYATVSRDTFSGGHILLIENTDTLSFDCEVRHRGGSSTRYAKKSYAVKLLDANGQKTDASLLGMRSDNYWILDAMAIDKARMRNRVAMDLWLDFSATPSYANLEPNVCNGFRGKFVEIYVNDSYEGIYCLMERIDRKQLKLKKAKSSTINGILYKSAGWQGSFFGALTPYDNTSATWMRYEYEYPDVEDSLITWQPLYDDMSFVSTATLDEFAGQAANRYDIPVFMDYFLFTTLLAAQDNCGNNLYLSYYNINQNSPLLITPWDMDHSFGRSYNSGEVPANTPCWKSNNALFLRFANHLPQYSSQLIDRYASLRRSVWAVDSLRQRFADYFQLFARTNAMQREQARWSGVDNIDLDFSAEEQYIYSWLEDRIRYTDSLFHYTGSPSACGEPFQPITARKILRDGHILILRGDKTFNTHGQSIK